VPLADNLIIAPAAPASDLKIIVDSTLSPLRQTFSPLTSISLDTK